MRLIKTLYNAFNQRGKHVGAIHYTHTGEGNLSRACKLTLSLMSKRMLSSSKGAGTKFQSLGSGKSINNKVTAKGHNLLRVPASKVLLHKGITKSERFLCKYMPETLLSFWERNFFS